MYGCRLAAVHRVSCCRDRPDVVPAVLAGRFQKTIRTREASDSACLVAGHLKQELVPEGAAEDLIAGTSNWQ